MIKVENIDVWGFEHAIRGMRNPLNSWDKSDSYPAVDCGKCGKIEREGICRAEDRDCTGFECYEIGNNDLNLMRRLFKGGTEHRKYARQIMVSMDITSHHTWWAEFDTYKVGVTRNSCSKMHRIHVKEFVTEDFSTEGIAECGGKTIDVFVSVLMELERLRLLFNETHDKKYWRAIIELLPMGYNLRATVTMNYENVFNIINQRDGHKVDEWDEFVEVLRALPYVEDILRSDEE